MRRYIPIRLTKNDTEEYKRLVRSSKTKIRRTNQKYGVDLSGEVELPKLGQFKTREEFNEWKEKQRSFTNKANTKYQFVKNEYGVVASKRKINEIKQITKEAQINAKKKIDEYKDKPYFVQGKQHGTIGQSMLKMGTPNLVGITIPKNFNFNTVRNKERLKQIEEGMKKKADDEYYDKRMGSMRENYLELLAKTFNGDADRLIKHLESMPLDDFYELYLSEEEFGFGYVYTEEESEKLLNQLGSYVEQYYAGKTNPIFNLRNR